MALVPKQAAAFRQESTFQVIQLIVFGHQPGSVDGRQRSVLSRDKTFATSSGCGAKRPSRELESGQFATISELAAAEKLDRSFVAHTLRLTLLAPDLVEAILDGKQPRTIERQPLTHRLPDEWVRQWRSYS
jgi:hypothetical protein